MGKEIERKFLLHPNWKEQVKGIQAEEIRQGYLCSEPERTVRVRIKGDAAYLTIKGKTAGFSRAEYEYSIPKREAEELLKMCSYPLIEKQRFTLEVDSQVWEIDEFFADNEGLVVAEAELESEEQALQLPAWIKEEVTHDKRYYNAQLVQKPFREWK
jgi:adenylate cyclase